MYLKFETRLEFPELARTLCPELKEYRLDWDSEDVYEWMYVDLPQLDFSLNVSREHGWADIDDEVLDQHQDDQEALRQLVHPRAVYVFGWNRNASAYVDELPDYLPSLIAVTGARSDFSVQLCRQTFHLKSTELYLFTEISRSIFDLARTSRQ